MSLEPMKQHGAFSWNELMTSNVSAAKDFYAQLLGWEMQDIPVNDMTYTLAKVNGTEVGGLMSMPADAGGMPPVWGSYVTVDDVDKRAAQAETLGGKIFIAPQDIPNIGRFAVIADPQGAMLSIITYNDKE